MNRAELSRKALIAAAEDLLRGLRLAVLGVWLGGGMTAGVILALAVMKILGVLSDE